MRVAYFEPFCGLSGEVILGALVDTSVSLDAVNADLHKLPMPGRAIAVGKVLREGVVGSYLEVSDRTLFAGGIGQLPGRLGRLAGNLQTECELDVDTMVQLIARSGLPPVVKQASISAVQILGIALIQPGWEAVGGTGELWSVNTLVEIVGTMSALSLLGIDRVECGPVGIGGYDPGRRNLAALGMELLLRTPGACAEHIIDKGCTTLTGVAIMLSITSQFGPMPAMRATNLGYGAGRGANQAGHGIVRVTVGEAIGNTAPAPSQCVPLPAHMMSSNPGVGASPAIGAHQQSGRQLLARSMNGEERVWRGSTAAIL